jgi:ectoine hydroxylase-related dioxygenase (phytanoyl-CoA dioxygenase family)
MQVTFGQATFQYPSDELGELRSSNDILHDADALNERLAAEGYLVIRGLIDPAAVMKARQTIFEHMAAQEAMEPGSRPLEGVLGQHGKSVSLLGRKAIVQHPDVKAVLEAPALFDFYQKLWGEPVLTFDYKWLRAVGHDQSTSCHYDVVYMGQGTQRLRTCWIPLGHIPIEQGVLAICEGSHNLPSFEKLRSTYGRLDVDRDRASGQFSHNPREILERFGGQWKTSAFAPGDIVTFGMYTLHASTTNTTDRWRLSCDVRYQPSADPTDPRWVGVNPPAHSQLQDGQPIKSMATLRTEWGL